MVARSRRRLLGDGEHDAAAVVAGDLSDRLDIGKVRLIESFKFRCEAGHPASTSRGIPTQSSNST